MATDNQTKNSIHCALRERKRKIALKIQQSESNFKNFSPTAPIGTDVIHLQIQYKVKFNKHFFGSLRLVF